MSFPGMCWLEQVTDLINQGSTTAALPAGYSLGMVRYEGAKRYRLAVAGGTIAQYAPVKSNSAATTKSSSNVVPTAGVSDVTVGICEVANVAAGVYFWMTVDGEATVTVTGAVTFGAELSASATAGTAQQAPYTATNGVQQGIIGSAVASQASGTANLLVRLQGLT
ncbi:MAG TPA: hypothetical protein V6C86_24140 [Oculatellaceae cyanobacterium]